MENIQDMQSGKTSQALSPPTKEKISDASSKASAKYVTKPYLFLRLISGFLPGRSWEMVTQSHGECSTRNTGERPNAENASTLSQILQAGVPEKYSLSQKACLGILRRASVRGKELPQILKRALEQQAERMTA